MKKTGFFIPKQYQVPILCLVGLLFCAILYVRQPSCANTPSREGLNEINTPYRFLMNYPSTDNPFPYKINDILQESIDVLTFLKIQYFPLISPKVNLGQAMGTSREYSGKIAQSQIYQKYQSIVSSSTNILDKVWKPFFTANHIDAATIQAFHDEFLSYSRDYAQLTFKFMHTESSKMSPVTATPDINAWVNYVISLVHYYRTNQNKLDTIKQWMYKIILPIEQYMKLIHHYTENLVTYSTKDDALFVLNTTLDAIRAINYESLLHDADGHLYVFPEEIGATPDGKSVTKISTEINRPLTVDGLTIYSTIVIMKIYYDTVRSVIDLSTFQSGYKKYLQEHSKPDQTLLLFCLG